MKYKSRLKQAGSTLLLSLFLWSAGHTGSAQVARPAFHSGEVILYCQPGTGPDTVATLAAKVNATSTQALGLADCYVLELPVAQQTDASTLAAVATLKAEPNVRWVGPNTYHYTNQTKTEPNDPLYNEQWGYQLINMPLAWTLQKGGPNTNVCVIDSGFDTAHPDLIGQYLASSYDFGNNVSSPLPDGTGPELQHGVHVSGTIIANTNNGIGVSGICWTNIKCMGLKVHKTGDPVNALNGVALINAYAYLMKHVSDQNIKVLNMSYGSDGADPTDTTNPEYIALKAIYDQGVVLVAAAGNSNLNSNQSIPAGYPFVVSVASEGPDGSRAAYSNYGKVEVTAPGGYDPNFITDNYAAQILSTRDSGYHTEQGTSMASPHVAGVAALMMSTTGVTRDLTIAALKSTANTAGLSAIPDTYYGYGRLDAYQALAKVSVYAIILSPDGTDANGVLSNPTGVQQPVETYRPRIQIQISQATPANVVITVDNTQLTTTQITNAVVSGNATGDTPFYTIQLAVPFSPSVQTTHKIVVTATNPTTGASATTTRYFTITPHTLDPQTQPNGILFMSIPYYESAADSPTGQLRTAADFLSPDTVLYRYNPLPSSSVYTTYTNTQAASTNVLPLNQAFQATDTTPPQPDVNPTNTDTRPIGLAYFARVNNITPVITYGNSVTNQSFDIPLHEGWNMIGDPFPFAVSFNSCQVQPTGGTRVPIGVAVDQKILQPYIYRYIAGDYQFHVLPDGILAPWEGHWIYVNPKNPASLAAGTVATMIVPPTPTTTTGISKAATLARATATSPALPAVAGAGSWALQLVARASTLGDSYNFVGMTANASNVSTTTRVPKPPKPSPYVTLGITEPTTPGTLYAQDLRNLGGIQTWNVTVQTDQAKTPVTLTWPQSRSIPRNYRLTITDKVTGQVLDLRNQSSYQFTPATAGEARAFELTAHPALSSSRAVISSIIVNPARSNGRSPAVYDIQYTTSQDASIVLSVMTMGGHPLATVGGTRAVTVGENHVAWTGRDNAGRVLPAGTYVLQLQAVTSDGNITRETRPLLITGR